MSADPNADRIAAADAPITPTVIAPESAFGDKRTCTDEHGATIPNCKPTDFHPGVDLVAVRGTSVVAPHDGWILFSGHVSDTQAPWAGYGPGVVLLAHDDVTDSFWTKLTQWGIPAWWPNFLIDPARRGTSQAAVYSVLAHIEPSFDRPMDSRVQETWGRTKLATENWQTSTNNVTGAPGPQHIMKFQPGNGRAEAWSAADDVNARYVRKGQILGSIGDAGHVHWEVRTSPLGLQKNGQAMDPMQWLMKYKGPLGMPPVTKQPKSPASDSGWGWLLFGLMLALSEKGR